MTPWFDKLVAGRTILLSLLLSAAVAYLLTPVVLRLALRLGAVDAAGVSARKPHATDTPRLGGVAIVGAFLVPLLLLSGLDSSTGHIFFSDPELALGLIGGGLAIALLGLYDDLRGASPKLKLLVQTGVAIGAILLGFRIEHIDPPFLLGRNLDLLAIPITLLWIVGITNAVNLIDGLDGLAAGVALFGVAPLAIIAIDAGNVPLALVCVCLAGSLLGFLVFNFHPARIFMGDTGSMFVGFVLALITIQSSHKSTAVVSLLVPVLVLGVPIMDTLLTVFRRAWLGNPLFAADRGHMHHRLMDRGLSHRSAVLVLYGAAALFAGIGTALHFNRSRTMTGWILLATVAVAVVLLRWVGYLRGGWAGYLRVGSLREGLRSASALRQRHLRVRGELRRIRRRLQAGSTLAEIVSAAREVTAVAGADWGQLTLREEADRTDTAWALSESTTPPPAGARQDFVLLGPGGEALGRVRLGWGEAGAPDESLVPVLDRCFSDLGLALWTCRVDRAGAEPPREARER